jgi:hypothetical protein
MVWRNGRERRRHTEDCGTPDQDIKLPKRSWSEGPVGKTEWDQARHTALGADIIVDLAEHCHAMGKQEHVRPCAGESDRRPNLRWRQSQS